MGGRSPGAGAPCLDLEKQIEVKEFRLLFAYINREQAHNDPMRWLTEDEPVDLMANSVSPTEYPTPPLLFAPTP